MSNQIVPRQPRSELPTMRRRPPQRVDARLVPASTLSQVGHALTPFDGRSSSRQSPRTLFDTLLVVDPSKLREVQAELHRSSENEHKKQIRQRFMAWLVSCNKQAQSFTSPVVYCDAMLSHVMNQEAPTTCNPIRVAAACWALDTLAQSSSPQLAATLSLIRDELFPAVFCGMERGGGRARAASTASSVGQGERQTSLGNVQSTKKGGLIVAQGAQEVSAAAHPFLGHDFFFEEHKRLSTELTAVSSDCNRYEGAVAQRQHACNQAVKVWEAKLCGRIFITWRNWHRKHKQEKYVKRKRRGGQTRDMDQLRKENAMTRWKNIVVQSKVSALIEKEATLYFQLDNAKNQFQLQCYRSDMFLRTIEELRTELGEARKQRDEARERVMELQRTVDEFSIAARADLNKRLHVVTVELNRWKDYAREHVDEMSRRIEDESQYMILDANSNSGSPRLMPSTTNVDTSELEEAEMRASQNVVEKTLLQWINTVLRHSVVSTIDTVTNFSQDFQSGEVILLLMHHVAPHQVPFHPLQESNLSKRAGMILEIAKSIGVSHLPRATDILEGQADLMVMVVAELFVRSFYGKRLDEEELAAAAAEKTAASCDDSSLTTDVQYDADMMPLYIQESEKELARLRDQERDVRDTEHKIQGLVDDVQKHAGFLTRERLAGNPVQILDVKEIQKYCHVVKARFQDLEWKYRLPPGMSDSRGDSQKGERPGTKQDKGRNEKKKAATPAPAEPEVDAAVLENWLPFDQQLDNIRKVMRKWYDEIRRVFRYYSSLSGSGGLMTDAEFWRFCGDIRVLDGTFTRATVDRIFTIANAENPEDCDEEPDAEEDMPPDDDENPETELVPSEFVECLIRMADSKVYGKMLHEKLDSFIKNYVAAYACKSDMDKFKKEIYNASTQAALKRFNKDMTKIFNYYARVAVGKSKAKMLALPDFQSLVKEGGMSSQVLDEAAVQSIVQAVQSDTSTEIPQISYHEFLEALVCMSVFKVPTPFVSVDKKVEVSMSTLIATLRIRLKNNGIILTDVKPMSLQHTVRTATVT